MVKIALKVLLVLLALFTIMLAYLLSAPSVPGQSDFELDIDQVRRLALSQPGLPVDLESRRVGAGFLPHMFVVAGEGFSFYSFDTYSYRILYKNDHGVIDIVSDEATIKRLSLDYDFDQRAFEKMLDTLAQARFIAATHEHYDHVTGLLHSKDFGEISKKVHFTREQLQSEEIVIAGYKKSHLESLKPLDYEKLHLLAPGVVLIKAPSHTKGSQMVYIQTEKGQEFLLVGDIAWSRDNIDKLKPHPRLISYALKEDMAKNLSLLRFLHDLKETHPMIFQVVAHSKEQMDEYYEKGLILKAP